MYHLILPVSFLWQTFLPVASELYYQEHRPYWIVLSFFLVHIFSNMPVNSTKANTQPLQTWKLAMSFEYRILQLCIIFRRLEKGDI